MVLKEKINQLPNHDPGFELAKEYVKKGWTVGRLSKYLARHKPNERKAKNFVWAFCSTSLEILRK